MPGWQLLPWDRGAELSTRFPQPPGRGQRPRPAFSGLAEPFFDKLIARRGLADPGVTLVTTKVELEEIRLKERRKKN